MSSGVDEIHIHTPLDVVPHLIACVSGQYGEIVYKCTFCVKPSPLSDLNGAPHMHAHPQQSSESSNKFLHKSQAELRCV